MRSILSIRVLSDVPPSAGVQFAKAERAREWVVVVDPEDGSLGPQELEIGQVVQEALAAAGLYVGASEVCYAEGGS